MADLEEEILIEDNIELENIFMDIFSKCDYEKSDNVEVSTLLKFISPFIDSNEEHFSELQKILDPLDVNPTISYEYFSNAMKSWTEKFNNNLQTNVASNEKCDRLVEHNSKQSTPTKNSTEKLNFDDGLNISNISSFSYAGSTQSTQDASYFNEQINELKHQNKKLTDLLSEVRGQLTISEEVNNHLQNDLEKLKRSHQMEQKTIEDLQKMRLEFEKEREETSDLIKNHNSVAESLKFYKKKNSSLRKHILDLESEVQKTKETINALQRTENIQNNKIESLKREIEIKTNENLEVQEKFAELVSETKAKETHIKDISQEVEVLRSDNNSLQKCLDDVINKNASIKLELLQSDSENDPEKRSSISLGPNGVFDDDCFDKNSNSTHRSPSPIESLQSELIKASNTDCFGSTYCEHKVHLLEREEEIENLTEQLREKNDNITDLNNLNEQLRNQITELGKNEKINEDEKTSLRNEIQQHANKISELQSEILILSKNRKLNEAIQQDNIKLKNEIAFMKIEKKRHSRLEQKINKLEEALFDAKSKSEQLSMLNNSHQEKKHEINTLIDKLQKDKTELEKKLIEKENETKSTVTNLRVQNDVLTAKNKRYIMSIESLEQKLQNFRKTNTDLHAARNDCENDLNNLVKHVDLAVDQIKGCTRILGKNTLLATRMWKSHLESIVKEIPVANLVDESILSGVMQMSHGKMSEDIKNLVGQTRLTVILLISLAKIKENQISDDEDEELSEVFIPDSYPLITQSTFQNNSSNFSVYIRNISTSSTLCSSSMSPECTQLEMAEEEINLSRLEIDDNIPIVPENNAESQNEERTEKQEEYMSEEFSNIENAPLKKCRSMSEGTSLAPQLTDTGDITVFPNLQDNVLESLGLHADQSRDRGSERLTEEEIEEKFHTLALIFSIDSKSLAQRRELQKRQRDQAQENFAVEVARLEQGIHRLAPLCVDREVKELVTALLTRLHIIVKAAQRISISTQVYGGVQQEFRITAAVNLMLVHLRNIQQQRDTVKRQLQCTKKMLQESTTTSSEPNSNVVARRVSTTANGRVVTRRRASIATIPRPLDSPSASGPAGIAAVTKRAVRRISADAYSEYSAKPWDSRHRPDWMPVANPAAGRLSRPSRIELGLDLTKIHEGSVDADSTANINDGSDSEMNSFGTPTGLFPVSNFFTDHQKAVRNPETFRDHTVYVLAAIIKFITYCWNRWMRNGTTHQMILFVIAIIGLSTIFMLNIAMWSRFFRQGILYNGIPWKWVTWDELWDIIFEVRNTGPHPI